MTPEQMAFIRKNTKSRRDTKPADWSGLLDVSHYQHGHPIDWQKVKASGIEAVFLKAADGEQGQESTFAADWSAAGSAGLRRSPYLFWQPDQDPDKQAANLIKMKPLKDMGARDLLPVIDVERQTAQSAAIDNWKLGQLIGRLYAEYGHYPILYTSARVCKEEGITVGQYCHLWVVWYGTGLPPLPPQWKDWDFFQCGFLDDQPGIVGDVDYSLAKHPLSLYSVTGQ